MQEPKLKMSLQKYLTIGMPERLAVLCPGAESRAQGPAHRGGQGPEGLHGGFDCAHLLVEVGDGFRFHLGGRRWTEEKLDNCALFRDFFFVNLPWPRRQREQRGNSGRLLESL